MIGRNPGRVTTQGEVLADLFVEEGWTVRETSPHPGRLLRLLDTITCLLRWRGAVDLVVLSVFSGPAFVMADVTSLVARVLGLPVVMVLHGGNLPAFEDRHPRWVRRVLGRATRLVAPSSFLASKVEAARPQAVVIPNVIDLADWRFQAREHLRPRLLWMRTFHHVYNPFLAVRVLQRIRHRWPDATLTMAGQDKGILDDVRREAADRGVSDAVSFPGFLGPADKAEVFADHDIYVHTNRIDNTPVSVLEAAAAGLPIVATAVGGLPHLLADGSTGLLVPSDDDTAMAQAVERLLTDPALASTLARSARLLVERSAWPEVLLQWQEVLTDACAASGRAQRGRWGRPGPRRLP